MVYFCVNGHLWALVGAQNGSEALQRSDGSYTIGMADNGLKTVYIALGLDNQMAYKVLCHELTHVFAFEYGYYMPMWVEEIVADYISIYATEIVEIAKNIMQIF